MSHPYAVSDKAYIYHDSRAVEVTVIEAFTTNSGKTATHMCTVTDKSGGVQALPVTHLFKTTAAALVGGPSLGSVPAAAAPSESPAKDAKSSKRGKASKTEGSDDSRKRKAPDTSSSKGGSNNKRAASSSAPSSAAASMNAGSTAAATTRPFVALGDSVPQMVEPLDFLHSINLGPRCSRRLARDYAFVCGGDMLVTLPRAPTVERILTLYCEHAAAVDPAPRAGEEARSVMAALAALFDLRCATHLLYDVERKQYMECVVEKNKAPRAVYGVEHLIRLIAALPAVTDLECHREKQVRALMRRVTDLACYLERPDTMTMFGKHWYSPPGQSYNKY